jgi:hypothetical protein
MSNFATPSPSKLAFVTDWLFACRIAARTFKEHPYFAALLVACGIGQAVVPEKSGWERGLWMAAEVTSLSLAFYVVTSTFKSLRGSMDQQSTNTGPIVGRLVGVSALYWLVVVLMGLLFILPGLFFAVRGSMALPIICIEGLGVNQSSVRSFSLVKGHFRQELFYVGLGCICTFLPIFIASVVLDTLAEVYLTGNLASTVDFAVTALVGIYVAFWQISVYALMTKFYVFLLTEEEEKAAREEPSVPMPQWNP